MDRGKERSGLSIFRRSIAISGILLFFLLSDKVTIPVEACVATSNTPSSTTTTCKDPSTLFDDSDDATVSLDKTGTQPVGTSVVATCNGQDTIFVVSYDDGTSGRQDQDKSPGNKEESITLTCNSSGNWKTKTVDKFSTSDSPVRTSGTVTPDDSITCEPYFKFFRFSVNGTEEQQFASLLSKAHELQPNFNGSLAWKDEDGDMVNLSSDTELAEAIKAKISNAPLRIFTKVDGTASNTFDAPPPYSSVCEVDDGDDSSSCNMCQKDLRAELVACLCTNIDCDYLLCTDCYAEGNHQHEHPLCRITLTEGGDLKIIESPAFCDVCGDNIRGILYNCEDCVDFDACQKCADNGQEKHDKNHVITCHAFTELVDFPYRMRRENDIVIHQLNGKIVRPTPSAEAKAWIGCLTAEAKEQSQHCGREMGLFSCFKKRITKVININSPGSSRLTGYAANVAACRNV